MANSEVPTVNPYQLAEAFGRKKDIYSQTGWADVRRLVEDLGGKVEIRWGGDDESLIVHAKGDFTVFVPSHTSKRRDRFTIAHELGHYVLHYLRPLKNFENPSTLFFRGGSDDLETEANGFAAALLMPADYFRQSWTDAQENLHEVAANFEVSVAAAGVRAKSLGLR